jgi:hypothetical protein
MIENLIVTAHPDDETLWFGGTVLSRPDESWTVVCVTEPADRARLRDLEAACSALGVKGLQLGSLPDAPLARLPAQRLRERLQQVRWEDFDRIWTHGPSGEYGHPHHQDVGWAVHIEAMQRNLPVACVAYHSVAEATTLLTRDVFRRKASILSEIYRCEFYAFAHLLPSGSVEAFTRIGTVGEVELVYQYYCGAKSLRQVRHESAGLNADELSHLWLREGISPPCPQQTFTLIAAADELRRRLTFGLHPRGTAQAPQWLPKISTRGRLWSALRRSL